MNGFSDISVSHQTKGRVFERKTGKSVLLNPKRYGAMTFYDYARWRLSIFTREEAQAIVAYLRFKRDEDGNNVQAERIDAALELYWLDRAEHAPSTKSLRQHLKEEEAYLAAISLEADSSHGE